jgi:tRNA-2-methylthio-N6-dimethylallyladenosine synthase
MGKKYLYIQTIGCQMNVYDSERMARLLRPLGYDLASIPEEADVILANTCTIRAKAEHKAFSFLGRVVGLKQKNPNLMIGIGGCVAQQEGDKILNRVPMVDLVFGTHAVGRLPELIERIASGEGPIVDISTQQMIDDFTSETDMPADHRPTSFITIMQGCDNFCTYCVVPYVRGREMSRSPEMILREIRGLVDQGVREVTLLGQNVNSYGEKEGLCPFPKLLDMVNDIDGLERIRFTTSHPKDFSDDLIHRFTVLEKLCNHIHLPVQSGSDRILKMMNRKYTRSEYLEKISKLRDLRPDIAITSDIIVGFPGETSKDFEETLDLIRSVAFDGLFAFSYSDRPNASAKRLPGKVSEKENRERLQAVLDLQEKYTRKKNLAMIGLDVGILVEGYSKKTPKDRERFLSDFPNAVKYDIQWKGRTSTNKVVNFLPPDNGSASNRVLTGEMVQVKIEKAFSHSLWGRLIRIEPRASGSKGEKNYAA